MRDPKRIDRIIDLLEEIWHENPDQRLGQLIANLFPEVWDYTTSIIFHMEDDLVEVAIEKAIRHELWKRNTE